MTEENKTEEQALDPVPRTKVLIAGRPFWGDAPAAQMLMVIESATRGMDREQFEDWMRRYKLRMELWEDAESNRKVVLCDGEKILGDWVD